MFIRVIKRFLISQRDAILMALAFSLVLYACGVLASEDTCPVLRPPSLLHFTAPAHAADRVQPDRGPPHRADAH